MSSENEKKGGADATVTKKKELSEAELEKIAGGVMDDAKGGAKSCGADGKSCSGKLKK